MTMAHGPGVASASLLIPLYQRAAVPLKAALIMRVIAVQRERERKSQVDKTLWPTLVQALLWATNHFRTALIHSLTWDSGCQSGPTRVGGADEDEFLPGACVCEFWIAGAESLLLTLNESQMTCKAMSQWWHMLSQVYFQAESTSPIEDWMIHGMTINYWWGQTLAFWPKLSPVRERNETLLAPYTMQSIER